MKSLKNKSNKMLIQNIRWSISYIGEKLNSLDPDHNLLVVRELRGALVMMGLSFEEILKRISHD